MTSTAKPSGALALWSVVPNWSGIAEWAGPGGLEVYRPTSISDERYRLPIGHPVRRLLALVAEHEALVSVPLLVEEPAAV